MAHQPFVPFLIICRNLLFPHVVQNLIQDHFILRYSKYAVPVRNRDDLMGSSGIESGNQIPFFYPLRSGTVLYSGNGIGSSIPAIGSMI